MKTVSSIYAVLLREQSAMQLSVINTRVMLQTGVNLRNASTAQNQDPATVTKVVNALNALGITA